MKELSKLTKDVAVINTKVEEIHNVLMGNGQKGLYQEFTEMKGGLKVFKWIANSALISSMISILVRFLK